ncbi:MAG: hypothetical protein A2V67_02985 [Deltaproteobacteria bacterium RBG_13_61_14]|nr:MAG: hypothetical protein A2V67_02985 [Deltaproteobacteria bacterium RBG_13_61_14]
MEYEVLIFQDGAGFLAEVPALPGCRARGETEKEALARVRKSIRSYLRSIPASSQILSPLRVRRIKIGRARESGDLQPMPADDPVLQLSGLGQEAWQGIDPDEYVRRERESWA